MSALLAVLLAQAWYTPAEAAEIFQAANDAYARQEYGKAREGYRALLDRGMSGADVLFNLGTTELAEGRLGEAVLYLERARRLRDDDDIQANLAVARARQLDQVVGAATGEPFLQRVAAASNAPAIAAAFLACWLSMFAAFWLWRWRRGGLWLLSFVLLLLASLGTGAGVAVHAYVDLTVQEGVVLPTTTQVRELPSPSAKVSFEAHAGLKVRVVEESGKFVRVRLPNGLEGWTEREGVAAL